MSRPRGSKQRLEIRRRTAVALRKRGLSIRNVAQEVGSAPSSVTRWEQMFDHDGDHGLDAIPQAGGKCRLTVMQKRRLVKYLRKSPRHFGWTTELWTLSRVRDLIGRKFGVRYHISHVHRLLRLMNFSAQKPARLARERDDTAIAEFREKRWPEIKKSPA
jgi:transposase